MALNNKCNMEKEAPPGHIDAKATRDVLGAKSRKLDQLKEEEKETDIGKLEYQRIKRNPIRA